MRATTTAALLTLALIGCGGAEADGPPPRPTPAVEPPVEQQPRAEPEAPVEPPPDPCPEVSDGVTVEADRLIVDGDIRFDLYAPEVDERSWPVIDRVANRVAGCEDVVIEIQVHTSTFGMSTFNARSSTAIAQAIRERLIAAGVPEDRVAACGYGETSPLVDYASPNARQQNERVQWVRIAGSAAEHVCSAL